MQDNIKIYRSLVNLIDELLIVIDENYNLVLVNNKVKYLNNDWNNILGTKCYLSIFNKIKPCDNCEIDALKRNETPKNIYHETTNVKGMRCILNSNFEKIDGNLFAEILRDVTEEKELVKKLVFQTKQLKANNVIMKKTLIDSKIKSEFLGKVLNGMPGGVMVVNKELKIIEINEFMKKNFLRDREIKNGDNCFTIYGYDTQCKDCYYRRKNNRTYRNYNNRDFTVFFNEFDNYLVETLIDTTRFIALANEIKAKQEELNIKQHQMALLNQDLLQLPCDRELQI